MTVLFRPQRGSLDAAMAEVREVGMPDLVAYAVEITGQDKPQLTVKPYARDERIDWDTYLVTVEGFGVLGYTNGALA